MESRPRELDMVLLDDPAHSGIQRLDARSHRLLSAPSPRCTTRDAEPAGFTLGGRRRPGQFGVRLLRFGAEGSAPVLVVCNMTPVPRRHYRSACRMPGPGARSPIRTRASMAVATWGTKRGPRPLAACRTGKQASLELTLPPLATICSGPRRKFHGAISRPVVAGLSLSARRHLGWPLGTNFAVVSAHAERMGPLSLRSVGKRQIRTYQASRMHRRESGPGYLPNARAGLLYAIARTDRTIRTTDPVQ